MKKKRKKQNSYTDFLKSTSSYLPVKLPLWIIFLDFFLFKLPALSVVESAINAILTGGLLTGVMYFFWKRNVNYNNEEKKRNSKD